MPRNKVYLPLVGVAWVDIHMYVEGGVSWEPVTYVIFVQYSVQTMHVCTVYIKYDIKLKYVSIIYLIVFSERKPCHVNVIDVLGLFQ